ncbi:universal stress protein [Noviherbaspirillum massiliense]|uniref:universal stress protein n=1 Tax=Noviherbaspirillum massiliense TaxID=1465823 RepID=UPI00047505CD|nr:universal stress protein [Noviherbaspirillum massiliense]
MKILFAVDGSAYTSKAAEFLVKHFEWFKGPVELHLLHVRLPIPKGLALSQAQAILGQDAVEAYYKEEADAAMAPAEKVLRANNIPFQQIYKVGEVAKEICAYATQNQMDLMVMGSHGHGALANVVMGSVATKVLATTKDIPVLVVR